jgi:antitoxin VapB
MAMNIKNEEAERLTRELADLTGDSLTTAIIVALRERLEKVRHRTEPDLASRLLAIGQDLAPRLHEPYRSREHGDLLYDDRGMPA